MTEKQWLKCGWDDLFKLAKFADETLSERKLRLHAVGCCRLIWKLIPKGPCRAAVDVAEAVADRQTPQKALTAARVAVRKVVRGEQVYWKQRAAHACLEAVNENLAYVVHGVAINVSGATLCRQSDAWDDEITKAATLALLHDVVGPLPFRKVALKPAWLTTTAIALARHIYEKQDFDQMPILADALQDAGCDNADILDHCRGKSPHVRGCWVVDLVLGKS